MDHLSVKLLHIFLVGAIILIAALLLNAVAQKLGLKTWYDFVNAPAGTNAISYIWLFIVYPFLLGLAAYLSAKILAN